MLQRQRQVLARFSVSALVASLPLLYVFLLRPPPAALAGDTAFWFLMYNCVVAAIVAADDAGALFFGSSSSKTDNPCCHDGNHSFVDSNGAVVPFVPTAVNAEGARIQQQVLASTPFFIQRDDVGEDPASKSSSADLKHASVPHQGQGDEAAIDKNSSVVLLQRQGEAADGALAGSESSEPRPSLVTGTGLVEEEIPEAWAIAQRSRTPDLRQGKSAVAGGEGKLRRSVTEGSKPAAAEESEYWEPSDEELNRRVEEFIARFNREIRRQIEQEAAGV